jgi:hypothetical protein
VVPSVSAGLPLGDLENNTPEWPAMQTHPGITPRASLNARQSGSKTPIYHPDQPGSHRQETCDPPPRQSSPQLASRDKAERRQTIPAPSACVPPADFSGPTCRRCSRPSSTRTVGKDAGTKVVFGQSLSTRRHFSSMPNPPLPLPCPARIVGALRPAVVFVAKGDIQRGG